MKEILLAPHDTERYGDSITLNQIREEVLTDEKLDRSIFGLDFDNTMVEDDVGIQVFMQMLLDPHYWEDNGEDFAKLLLPKKYQQLLQQGVNREISELEPEYCQLAFDLTEDIIALYREIQKRLKSKKFEIGISVTDAAENPLISEFARKMIALDQIMVKMDRVFSVLLNGAFLLRTRFFRNKGMHDIRRITLKLWESADQIVTLDIDESPRTNGHTKKVTRDHPLIHSPKLPMRLSPVVDQRTFAVASQILQSEYGPRPSVITTNHPIIPDTIIQTTDWRKILFENRHLLCFEAPLVRGTKLERDKKRKKLRAATKGRPVYGQEKRKVAKEVAKYHNRIFRIAIGDSFGDTAMGHEAIINEGIFIVVPEGGQSPENPEQAIENTRKKFHDEYVKTLGIDSFKKHIQQGIFYLMPNQQAQKTPPISLRTL